jgi:hypothetical protein
MEHRLAIANDYITSNYPVTTVLKICSISSSTYYYNPIEQNIGRSLGRPASSFTYKTDGSKHSNDQVLADIIELLNTEFVDYGYAKTTCHLKDNLDYVINSKKVYRIMSENQLLNPITSNTKRLKHNWVKDFVPKPIVAFTYFEFDIKYIYVAGKKSNAQVLTVLDVYSRWVLGQYIAWDITHKNVIELFDGIFKKFKLPEKFFVRCDNGSQFAAYATQKYFENKNVDQEFTRPATPEQNAHIESYHSIVENIICQKYEIKDIVELKNIMIRFQNFYNFVRIHSGSENMSPNKFLLRKGINMEAHMLQTE